MGLPARLRPVLVGDDLGIASQWGAVVVGILVVPLAVIVFGYDSVVYVGVSPRVVNYAGALGAALLAGAQAYQNRGSS